jgi:hypothetical protein
MKTETENKRLFEEAQELRKSIKACLHDRAKNNNTSARSNCVISGANTPKNHNK